MATADEYAAWIVDNADKQGTPEFETVRQAYEQAKSAPTNIAMGGETYQINAPASNVPAIQLAEQSIVSDVPQLDAQGRVIQAQPVQAPKPAPTLGERLAGLSEAGLSLATGATTGAMGMVRGTAEGLMNVIMTDKLGTYAGAKEVERKAMEEAARATYQPTTALGKEYTQKAGEMLGMVPPVMPLGTEIAATSRGMVQAAPIATAAAERAAQPVIALAERVTKPVTDIAERIRPAPAPATTSAGAEQVGTLINKAIGGGLGSTKAKEDLAAAMQINPEAKAAADRLGIDLPPDVFSDNPMVREATGLTRSVAGSEASAAWQNSLRDAVDKADSAIANFDAKITEGAPDVAQVSQDVLKSLTDTKASVKDQAKQLFSDVDAAIPDTQVVNPSSLQSHFDNLLQGLLGDRKSLSPQETKLLGMIEGQDKQPISYLKLKREKDLIFKALNKEDSPYKDMSQHNLEKLYDALSKDQLGVAEQVGGEELRQKLRSANLLWAKQSAIGKRIVSAYGNEFGGSIAGVMRGAIEQGAKGNVKPLNDLLKVVPQDLHKQTVATALMSVSRAKQGANKGAFGFSEFADAYRGLRRNAPVYSRIVGILGPEADKTLRDLYVVSKRITDARANVLTTGKANQALLESMRAEGLVSKIMGSTKGKAAVQTVAASVAGPFGAGAASFLSDAIGAGKKDAVKAAGNLFASPEFQELAVEVATKPKVKPASVNKTVMSKAFQEFAKTVNLPKDIGERQQWIYNALQMNRPAAQANETPEPK